MENNEKNTVLSDEQLKEVAGGWGAPNAYCLGHTTEKSCRATHVCAWHPSNTATDPATGELTGGWCVSKGTTAQDPE